MNRRFPFEIWTLSICYKKEPLAAERQEGFTLNPAVIIKYISSWGFPCIFVINELNMDFLKAL